jgi:hypothetical protein
VTPQRLTIKSVPPLINGSGQIAAIPRNGTAKDVTHDEDSAAGLAIDTLGAGTTLVVRTRKSLYRIVVVNGLRQKVLVQGGRLLPDAVHACIQGSSLGGSLLKIGWIGVGFRLELVVGGRRIVTSRVESIAIGTNTIFLSG